MNKRVCCLAVALLTLFTLCSCENKSSIEEAAIGYLQAMGDYRPDEAIPFATQYTRNTTIPVIKRIIEHSDTAYIRKNSPSVITINDIRMVSDSIARVYYHKHTPIKDVDDSVTVVKEENKWLVDVRINVPSMLLATPDSTQVNPRLPKLNGSMIRSAKKVSKVTR